MRREALSGDYDPDVFDAAVLAVRAAAARVRAARAGEAGGPPLAFPSRSRPPSTGCTSLAGW
jgi:hypothetical protein